MTEAQRANLHMLETWPRERIQTHHFEERNPPTRQGMKPPPDESARRRAWIKEHLSEMSQKDMAAELGVSAHCVSRYVKQIGATTKWTSTRRLRKWLLVHARTKTIGQMAAELGKHESTIGDALKSLGITPVPAKRGRPRKAR